MRDLWLVWLAFVPAVVESWICLFFAKGMVSGKESNKTSSIPVKLLIQITSRNAPKELLDNSIAHVLQAVQEARLKEYRIWVVTDTQGYKHESVQTIFVPPFFTARCKYKARALEYAKRERTRLGMTGKDWWIYYLDEENIVSGQALTAVSTYVKEQGHKRPVAVGPITYLRSGSVIAHLCDSIRFLGYVEAHFFMRHFGYFYLQGENTLVRSDIEQKVGWEFGDALAEDLLNGIEIRRKTGVKFGWHGGMIKSLSPETVGDLIKQRRRWYCGGVQGVFKRRIPLWQRVHLGYRLGIWTLGFFTIALSVVGILLPYEMPLWGKILLVPTFLLFPVVYFAGALANGVKPWRSVFLVFFVPVLAFIETSSAMYSLVRPAHRFEIIRKQPLMQPKPMPGLPTDSDNPARELVEP